MLVAGQEFANVPRAHTREVYVITFGRKGGMCRQVRFADACSVLAPRGGSNRILATAGVHQSAIIRQPEYRFVSRNAFPGERLHSVFLVGVGGFRALVDSRWLIAESPLNTLLKNLGRNRAFRASKPVVVKLQTVQARG